MTTAQKSSPQDVFTNLFMVIALYVSAGTFLHIVFSLINAWFPDALASSYYNPGDAVRGSLAALIIVFPIFIWISRFISRDIERNAYKKELRLRKWLLYFTLFVAGALIVVDLITLVRFFLEGEITARFILKVVSVLTVGAFVFWYYLRDVRDERLPQGTRNMIAWIVSSIVLLSIVGAFFVAGSPFKQRDVRFDQERVSDLQSIQWRIVTYWQEKDQLPETLSDLEDNISGFIPPTDPETGASYEYIPTGPLSFELCALFTLPSGDSYNVSSERFIEPVPVKGGVEGSWAHDAGRVCFERDIDPELYDINT